MRLVFRHLQKFVRTDALHQLFQFPFLVSIRYCTNRVIPMTRPSKRGWRKLRHQVPSQPDPSEMLDVLLALDRMLVEVSMRLYNVPRHDRHTMRKQNRHLHAAVREHLPRLLKPSRRPF